MSIADEKDGTSQLLNPVRPGVVSRTIWDYVSESLRQIDRRCDRSWLPPLIFFVLGVAFAIVPVLNAVLYGKDNRDYSVWYEIGVSVSAGEPLYADLVAGELKYMYPPTAAVLFYAPLTNLGPVGFTTLLSLLNAIAWAFSVRSATTLIAGRQRGQQFFYSIAPGLAVAPYVWDIQHLGQTNLMLLALTLGTFVALRHRDSTVAGALFGAAVAMKAFPLTAIAYLIVRRAWMSILVLITTLFVLVWFLPGMVRGFDRNAGELRQWAALMIADQTGETMAARSSIGFSRRNQSLVSCGHRLLRHIDAGDDREHPLYINVAEVRPWVAHAVGYSACLLLGCVLLLACRFHFAPSPECEGLEIAMVCTLVPLCSPLAWTYFYCWLLPAWTAVGFWFNNPLLKLQTRRFAQIGAAIAGALLISAVSEQIDPTLQAYGVTAFGSVTLFLTLAYIRFKLPNGIPAHFAH